MKLILKKNGIEVLQKDLDKGQEYIIGRHSGCEIRLDQEEGISRQHLKLYFPFDGTGWILEVLSEQGGLFFKGESVDQVEIQNTASFSLKNYTLEFVPEGTAGFKGGKTQETSSHTHTRIETTDGGTRVFEDSQMAYFLVISAEGDPPEHIDLGRGESWVVGRDNDSDISIEHKHLTRKHFQIVKTGSQFQVKDLGSANGTYLNGEKLSANAFHPLKSEDVISVSNLTFKFEAQQKDFSKIIKNLPVSVEEEQEVSQLPGQFAVPKVILEDTPVSKEQGEESYFNRKRIILFSSTGVFLIGLFVLSFVSKRKTDKQNQKKDEIAIEQYTAIQNHYALANRYYGQKKFQFCIDELKKLHIIATYHKDSKQLATACETAKFNQEKEEQEEKDRKDALKVQAVVKKIIDDCQKRMDEFENVSDLDTCLNEAILKDPGNARILELQQTLQEREIQEKMSAERKEENQRIWNQKMALYRRAKAIHQKGDSLGAVVAYKQFLQATKNNKSFQKTRDLARQEMTDIQTKYDNTLNTLYNDCETLINQNSMKQAYSECQNILKFEPKDKKVLQWMKKAKDSLQFKMKDTYRDANLQESLGNIAEAKESWKKILSQDVEDGYYYKKAKIQLDKYR